MAGRLTPGELDLFLEKYVECRYSFTAAAKSVGRAASTFYDALDRNEDFARRFHQLRRVAGDEVYAELLRRAIDGVEKPVYQGGELVGHVREYSDSLLAHAARALLPGFGDKGFVEVKQGVDVSDAELAARIASIFAAAQRRKALAEKPIDAEFVALPAPKVEDLL